MARELVGVFGRTRSRSLTLVAAAGLAGCGFNHTHYSNGDAAVDALPDAVAIDSPVTPDASVDAAVACQPDSIVCDDATGHYVECSSTGTPTFEQDCPLGCAPAVEKCLDVAPSNGLAPFLDQARTDPAVIAVSLSGNSTIDTETGEVVTGAATVTVPTAVFNGMRVLMFGSLSISGTVKVTSSASSGGSKPLALVVDGDVTIQGTLDVSADGTTAGPGGLWIYDTGTCFGAGYTGTTDVTPHAGSGGGGHATAGARGGNSGDGDTGYTGGASALNAGVVPLVGGCPGGAGLFGDSFGGAGGGAVQIVSRTSISLIGNGVIDASGGGGSSNVRAGGGGGAGGSVLLEAPQVILNGAGVVLSTKGGGGGAAGGAAAGADGGTSAIAAPGGNAASGPDGGAGGTEATSPVAGSNGSGTQSGGGGGGSVGQVRFNTATGTINAGSAAIRSQQSIGVLATRQVP